MAEKNVESPDEESHVLFQEQYALIEECLVDSRKEVVDLTHKYEDISEKVSSLINLRETDSSSESFDSDHLDSLKETKNDLEEHSIKLEDRIAAYQQKHDRQAKDISDLHSKVEEYRLQCAKLEAALRQQSLREDSFRESDSQTQNVQSVDLDTALLQLEQERSRCRALEDIQNQMRKQLEIATKENETLTLDFQQYIRKYQIATSELLAKEAVWKEEEQSFSVHMTHESNFILSLWRQVKDFQNDFKQLKNLANSELESFKVCFCHTAANIAEITDSTSKRGELPSVSESVVDYSMSRDAVEISKLYEKVSDLKEENKRLQKLLEEKSKTVLSSSIEKISETLKETVKESHNSVKTTEKTKIIIEGYTRAAQDLTQILIADCDLSVADIFPLSGASFLNQEFPNSNLQEMQGIVNAVKQTIHEYKKQIQESQLKLSKSKEQNELQRRTNDFLEDEREKLQQVNILLSSKYESINLKLQDLLQTNKEGNHTTSQIHSLETIIKTLNEQIKALQKDLLTTSEELRRNIQVANEEVSSVRHTDRTLTFKLERSSHKIEELEKSLENCRKDYLAAQGRNEELILTKELLEQEKIKLSSDLCNLERQCGQLKKNLTELNANEGSVREKIITLETLITNSSAEKGDLMISLEKVESNLEAARSSHIESMVKWENERSELKRKLDELSEKCSQLESERDRLQERLLHVEDNRHDVEEDRSQVNDLANQITKFSNQKKNADAELEQVRAKLNEHIELLEAANKEKNELMRSKSELTLRSSNLEEEIAQAKDILSVLKDEKASQEKTIYDVQQTSVKLREELKEKTSECERNMASLLALKAQLRDVESERKKCTEDAAREREDFSLKMQELKDEFQRVFQKEKEQHDTDIEYFTKEKDALREKMLSSIDELYEKHEKKQDELLSQHQKEVVELKSQINSYEIEYAEKMLQLKTDSNKIHDDCKSRISSLSDSIDSLKKELFERESELEQLKLTLSDAEQSKMTSLQEASDRESGLAKQIDDLKNQLIKETSILKYNVQDLEVQKESLTTKLEDVELKMKEIESQKDKIANELDERNSFYETEKLSQTKIEERLSLLQEQLNEEQSRSDVTTKSFEDCKGRLMQLQIEHHEAKKNVEYLQQQLTEHDSSLTKSQALVTELKSTLREVERSRQESRREVSSLRRNVSRLEKELSSQKKELEELNYHRNREEEAHETLKKEIQQIKQNLLESAASRETLQKELSTTKARSAELEHKLKMQQEQQQSLLQECLQSEQKLSEQRLQREKNATDAAKDMQLLRAQLHAEEGRVLALEAKIVKMDGSRRDLESKLYSVCTFMRSVLGLGQENGFLSVHSSSRSSVSESSRTAHMNLAEVDVDFLKSGLNDLLMKANTVQKERDELKNILIRVQKDFEDLREDHSHCVSRTYNLKKELQEKRSLQQELSTKTAHIGNCEEKIRVLEREKKHMTQRISSIDEDTFFKEKDTLQERISQLLKSERSLQEEVTSLRSINETVESKTSKFFTSYYSLETDASRLKKTLSAKEQEIQDLEWKLDSISRQLKSSEFRNKSLQSTIDQLNAVINSHLENEKQLKQKIKDLSVSLSETSSTQQNLYKEIELKQKENINYQSDLFKAQQLADKLRSSADEHRLKCRQLQERVEDLQRHQSQNDSSHQDQLKQINKLQKLLSSSQKAEHEFENQVSQLQNERDSLEKKVSSLAITLRKITDEKMELNDKMEKETTLLKKSLSKFEKERAKSSEFSSKSLIERSSLEKSLSQLSFENQTLQQKVQNLQAQLAELEERHSQRLHDLLKNQDSLQEGVQLRSALKKAEQLLEAKEKTFRHKTVGYQEQISVLKSHLDQEQQRWRKYHERSRDISHLHEVLGKSLSLVTSGDPSNRLIPEAERLEETTQGELTNSPDIRIHTPSRFKRTPSAHDQRTSTPKAKKHLQMPKS